MKREYSRVTISTSERTCPDGCCRVTSHTAHGDGEGIAPNLAESLVAVDDDPIGTLALAVVLAWETLPMPEPEDKLDHNVLVAAQAFRDAAEALVVAETARCVDAELAVDDEDGGQPF